jgi:hypothetical protein
MPKRTRDIDIIDIKVKLGSGRLATKINSLGGILLEDTQTCETIKLMQLPEGYSFHEKGKWNPVWEYTSKSIDHPMEGREAWSCSECGWTTDERHNWCTCGADMRNSKKPNKELQDLLEVL